MQDSKKYPLHQFFYEEWIAPLVDLHTKLREHKKSYPSFPLTDDLATRLSEATGNSKEFWINLSKMCE